MKEMRKLGRFAVLVAAALIFSACPTSTIPEVDDNNNNNNGGGGGARLEIFADGGFHNGASFDPAGEGNENAQLQGGDIVLGWAAGGYFNITLDMDPALDISEFTQLAVEWSEPTGGG